MNKLVALVLFFFLLVFAPTTRADDVYTTCRASRPARLAAMKSAVRIAGEWVKKAAPHSRWVLSHCEMRGEVVYCDGPRKGLDVPTARWILNFDPGNRVYSGSFEAANEACELPDAAGFDFFLISYGELFDGTGKNFDRILGKTTP